MRTTSGYDWVWFPTRLAIYARDGWRCLACGAEAGERRLERLSLDHVVPTSAGGDNGHKNLITLCVSCNSARRAVPLAEWRPELVAIARRQVRRKLDREAARKLAEELRPQRFASARLRGARRYLAPDPALAAVPF